MKDFIYGEADRCNYNMDNNAPHNPNPLHQHNDGTWWFYEESWSMESGPYPTKVDAEIWLAEYVNFLENGI